MSNNNSAMTALQEEFCRQMLVCNFVATDAYKAAGGKAKHPDRAAAQVYAVPKVKYRIEELKAQRSEKTGIDAEYVLLQAVKLHERCMQEIKPKTFRNGDPILDDNGDPVYEFNAAGAAKALELVGKHVEVQAFKERIEHSGNIEIESLTDEQLDARIAAHAASGQA